MVVRASSALAVLMPPSRRKSAACCVLAINLAILDSAFEAAAASSDDSNVSLQCTGDTDTFLGALIPLYLQLQPNNFCTVVLLPRII